MQFDLFYEIAQPPFIERYRAAWRASVAPRIGMTVGVLCLEDAARARSPAKQAFTRFYFDAGFRIQDSAASGQEPPLRTRGRVEVDPPHHQRPEAPGAEQNPTTRC